ncbi:MAG: hypothetical protein S4CHLAM37_09270 [Chlamydiia bacterium]|nr:hypothetical protein [Chlamydiia bacterium]
MDPFGNVLYFSGMLEDLPKEKRFRTIMIQLLIGLAIIFIFFFYGEYMLYGLYVSYASASVGGGIILFMIAARMVFLNLEESEKRKQLKMSLPPSVTLVAGPGVLAFAVIYSGENLTVLGAYVCVLIPWALSSCIFIFSAFFLRIFGPKGLKAIEKLMGLILTIIAAELLLEGIAQYVSGGMAWYISA